MACLHAGGARHKEMCTLMAQLARLQQLAVTWLSAPQEVPSRAISQTLPDFEQIPSSEDQVHNVLPLSGHMCVEFPAIACQFASVPGCAALPCDIPASCPGRMASNCHRFPCPPSSAYVVLCAAGIAHGRHGISAGRCCDRKCYPDYAHPTAVASSSCS